jgi:SAM-dependent methyltransferase
LPKGRVYGVDIEKGMVDYLNDRAKREGLSNLSSLLGEIDNPKLPEPVDRIFICNTYHHIENRQHYFDTLKKSIRTGGKLVIIDFLKGSLPVGPPDNMKLAAESVVSELSGAGYRLVQKHEFLPYQYFLVFQTIE